MTTTHCPLSEIVESLGWDELTTAERNKRVDRMRKWASRNNHRIDDTGAGGRRSYLYDYDACVEYAHAHGLAEGATDQPRKATAMVMGRATLAGPAPYVFDNRNKNARYLIRNGSDGAMVNQLATRVHAVAYAMGSPDQVAARLESMGMGAHPNKPPRIDLPAAEGEPPCMVHISTRDIHVGEPGDPEEYEDEIRAAVLTTLRRVARAFGRIDTINLTLGSDWCTIDNVWRQTTRGTQLHTQGSIYEIMAWSERMAIMVVDLCRQVADRVVCITEQGNHDAIMASALGRVCGAWYRDCSDVEVRVPLDGGIRTYFLWEDVLCVGHHGHIKSPTQLPQIIAAERPKLWGRATWRYLFTGHRHHSAKWPAGDRCGIELIQARSPSPPTEHEHRLGYSDTRGLESFVFHAGRGKIADLRA